jgi:hypothetical protein
MINDPNRIYDGFDSVEGGVDGGRRANVIGTNQVFSADNCVFRGGLPISRPGIRLMQPNFDPIDKTVYYDQFGNYSPPSVPISGQDSETRFSLDTFQSASYYSPKGSTECIVALIGGRAYKLIPQDYSVDITEIKLDQRNNKNLNTGYLKQADRWMVIQDGTSIPLLYDGSVARRAKDFEVPVGDIMAYGMGRLVVCRNGHEVIFGDLYGSHDGDPGDSVIQFTETQFLAEGLPSSIPFALGKITGAEFFPQLDTSTGIGQLLVFTSRGGVSFDLSLPRDQWKTSAFQELALLTTGARGWRSIAAVNEDLWMRSDDGSRSFRQARSELTGWHHLPLSTNVRQYFNTDTPELLDFANSIYFDNRLFTTTGPVWNHGRVFHTGVVVLDFDILSSFGSNARPAWDGRWNKVQVTQLVTGIFNGRRRAFAFGILAGNNALFELTANDRQDWDGPISSEIIGRAFDFSRDRTSNPFSEKELYGGDVWLSEVSDNDSYMDVSYRPDDYSEWLPWGKRINVDAIGQYQTVNPNTGEPELREGFMPRAKLEKPEYDSDPTTKRSLRRGFNFQVKFNWTGYMALQRFRIQAQQLIEKS